MSAVFTDLARHVLLLAVPLLYLLASAAGAMPGRKIDAAWRMANASASLALAAALLSMIWLLVSGPAVLSSPVSLTFAGLAVTDLSARADLLGTSVLLLVCFIGWVIVRYSRTYLAGDPHQLRYVRALMATLAAVAVVVLTNNLAVLSLAWLVTSVALHRLLTLYDRQPALIAAHKKFLISRLADLCMFSAIALIAHHFHTLAIDEVLTHARALPVLPLGVQVAVVLIAISAALKCAQLPTHGWLIQVMEAPTPVSALLHAGVVNLGGFVLIRFSDLLTQVLFAQALLVVVGSITAVVAALVAMTRISIKVALAWSTCAQMGFMLMECGLGAFDVALLHLVAHSLYKAHAFLDAGGAVHQARVQQLLLPQPRTGVAATLWGMLLSVAIVCGAARSCGIASKSSPTLWVLALIVGLALTPLLTSALTNPQWRNDGARTLALVGGATALAFAYFGLHTVLAGGAFDQLPSATAQPALLVWVVLCFALLFALQTTIYAHPQGALARRLYPIFYAGLYLDELFTRITFRLWPARLAAPELRAATPLTATNGAMSAAREIPFNLPADLTACVAQACQRIAPTWPLDRLIAVNPWWGFVDLPIETAAATVRNLSGAHMLMDRAFYREQWRAQRFGREHLAAAITAARADCSVDDLVLVMDASEAVTPPCTLVTDLIDGARDLQHAMAWRDFVTHQISQHCAAYFDRAQASWGPDRDAGLYAGWRRQLADDFGARLLMADPGCARRARQLPETPMALIEAATHALGVPADRRAAYFSALLLSINGWASWCAYERWQARLTNGDDDHILQLLAIRLAWEWLLYTGDLGAAIAPAWHDAWRAPDHRIAATTQTMRDDWLLQDALERAYQTTLCEQLLRPSPAPLAEKASVQAVFCIDVRSEVFRRALEVAAPSVQTHGFAGFFGLPIAYTPLGTNLTRPQLPGLLAPVMTVTERSTTASTTAALGLYRQHALHWQSRWQAFRTNASSAFTFVETLGLLYFGKLLRRSLPSHVTHLAPTSAGLSATQRNRLRPLLPDSAATNSTEPDAPVELAAGILAAMGLTAGFARLVLLAGHGSQTDNNPHAAGLDCGACGGQTGEVNARSLAELLNRSSVRAGLRQRHIDMPDDTHFVAGLHNTTTDEISLFDLEDVPDSHTDDLAMLTIQLAHAGVLARAERAPTLGIDIGAPQPKTPSATSKNAISPVAAADAATAHAAFVHAGMPLQHLLVTRANDWAQVRPEWGLANNAAFIVAPRRRSQHLNLAGRAFLHDYRWQDDTTLATLELIMTAPMIVTHWINLQYYASTVDNLRYGSGNKVLHNVVGGRLGVFEGNGGDLRIGLPLQSLHDGEGWRHTPLRLSVFVEAPLASITMILEKHDFVRQLLDHGWLHLFRIAPEAGAMFRYLRGDWQEVARDDHAPAP